MIARKSLLIDSGVGYQGGWTMPEPHAGIPHAKQLRDKVAHRYDEATSYALPGKDGINAGPDQSEIYDDTAVIAVPEFASRIQQGIMPPFSKWASFVVGIVIEQAEQKDELARALEVVDRFLFEMINSSNFAVEASECFTDLALGTMAIRIDESALDNPLNARSLPLRTLSFCIGPDGLPDPVYEHRELPLNALKVHYPDAALPADLFAGEDPYAKVQVVEAWHRDWSKPTQHHYRQSVFLPGKDNRVVLTKWVQGAGSRPTIVARWSKSSGEGWGRGPLFNLLPSLRKVNFAERALLDHTDIALAGIWTMEDDGVVNPLTVKLEPGTMVPTAMGSQGLRNVAPGANFDIAAFMLKEARENIRKGLFTEQLGNPNQSPKTATEIQQRMAELARAVGAPFARQILEFVLPVVIRCLYILQQRGLIKMPVVDGKKIKLIATSPMAQSQRFELIDALDRFAGTLQARLGPEMSNVVLDGTAFADELATQMQVPRRVMRPAATQAQIVQTLTQQAAAAQNPAGDGGQADSGAASGAPA